MQEQELQPAAVKKTARGHRSLRIDMTPMVDLGFLLITFFIFTTTMAEKTSMKLVMPSLNGGPTSVPASKALTILLAESNKVYAYQGRWEDAMQTNGIISTGYKEADGIGQLIREKQKELQQNGKTEKDELVLMIMPTDRSTYKNVIDALDEAAINNVKRYVIVDAPETQSLFARH